jgi:hypothetical protein
MTRWASQGSILPAAFAKGNLKTKQLSCEKCKAGNCWRIDNPAQVAKHGTELSVGHVLGPPEKVASL